MIVDKLHKRSVIKVLEPDIPNRKAFLIANARSNALLDLYQLLLGADFQPGDRITMDIKILIERKK